MNYKNLIHPVHVLGCSATVVECKYEGRGRSPQNDERGNQSGEVVLNTRTAFPSPTVQKHTPVIHSSTRVWVYVFCFNHLAFLQRAINHV